MAQQSKNNKREIKMQKVVKLKEYLDSQQQVLRAIFIAAEEEVKFQENDEVKQKRKVYETLEYFDFEINPEKYTVSIRWHDDFHGDVFTVDVSIDSQLFCYAFMAFYGTLTYRIMAVLQYYDPNGWCFNEFWKTRLELHRMSAEIFGYYADCGDI